MITKEQYLEAKKTVDAYNDQLKQQADEQYEKLLNSKKGDYLTYIGGSESKNLIKGNKYRLTTPPWRRMVAIINETGKRQVYSDKFFSV